MKNKTTILVAAALATGLIAAGCGGDDDSDSSSDLTKAEFITQADAICKSGNDALNAAPQPKSQADVEAFVTSTVVPNVQKQVDGVRDLGAPSGDEDQINAMLDSVQKGIDTLEADPSIVTQQGAEDPFADGNQKAKDYGLQECGQG